MSDSMIHAPKVDRFARLRAAAVGTGLAVIPRDAVILADVSDSMRETAAGGHSRIQLLRGALGHFQGGTIVPFAGDAEAPCSAQAIPEPHGGTRHGAALRTIAARRPGVVLIISDGETWESRASVCEAAVALGCKVNTLFVGDPDDTSSKDLLREIAKATGGTFDEYDMGRMPSLGSGLNDKIGGMLALPSTGYIAL